VREGRPGETRAHVALDGTKIKANASKHKAMNYGRMEDRAGQLEAEVAKWLSPAGGRSRQSFVTAIQSTSTSKGPVHSGTQKKMRAGGFFGKKRL
jgi:hypothetical protein